jgi:signal transduction histidine kinase
MHKQYLSFFICLLGISLCDGKANNYEVNIEAKVETLREMVEKAVPFFKKSSIEESCQAFMHDTAWRSGEIGVFVFNEDGDCYVFGDDASVIWKNFQGKKSIAQLDFISEMVSVGKDGGTIDFRWNNGTMHAYVRTVQKDDKTFIIGAGFYPTSSAYATKELVSRAVLYGETHSVAQLFEQINNPNGIFVYGDIYLYAYDLNGTIKAHGESPELIGTNELEQKKYANERKKAADMIAIAKSPKGEGWYSYKSLQGGYEKRVYVKRLNDKKNDKQYLIAGGYYPGIDQDTVIALVKRAASYLQANGAERSFPAFSKRLGEFATGSAMLFAYDMNGITVADMSHQNFIGLDLSNSPDAEGKPIGKLILEHAQRYPSGGWLSFSLRNTYAMMYVEKVSVEDGDFVIGASYYPISKYFMVRFMTDHAVLYLKANKAEHAFNMFASTDSDFLRGDISIFVYDNNGINMVDGQKRYRIWSDNKDLRDDKGRLITDRIVAVASSGGGWFDYAHNNGTRRLYVDMVEKPLGKDKVASFIVGSSYYL